MEKRKTYSTYEAKARLSEILRAVRERGESALISYRGEPIAEIRPIGAPDTGLARRVERLARAGVVVRGSRRGSLKPLVTREGALERFLAERSD